MADQHAARAKGRCPECERVISGRAVGVQRRAADREFVALQDHHTAEQGGTVCLTRGARRVVPRVRDAT